MIGVQNEQQIESLCRHLVDLERLRRNGEEHMHQVFRISQVITRIDEWLACVEFVRRGCNRRQLGENPVSEYVPLPRVMDVHRVVIVGGHRTDHGG